MPNLKRTLVGMLVLNMLALLVAPYAAAAQTSTTTKTYEVTVTNITNSMQGLSPLVLATHPASAHAWQMGQPASKGLELLAEEGMPDMLASELKGVATDIQTTHTHLLPGDSITVKIRANQGDVLSAATMLIETNDGFSGLDSVDLNAGTQEAMAYDAGTEDNTEAKADVPGPPFGGKNHGPDTNPRQPVSMHPGITGNADVTPDFKWSGPVARFEIREVDSTTTVAPGMTAYDVTVTNINNSMQGLSPLVLASHPASAHAWQMGQPASKGLELLAREGMPDTLASELKGAATDVQTTHAHMLPGDSITVRIMAKQGDVLSAASMLIQTNDGFTGLDGAALSDGASKDTDAYDAGAEDNTEAKADVPGPPFGGKNHGPDTNPRQPISMHPGISGKADVPAAMFNWSGPVARFEVHAVSTPMEHPEMAPSGTGNTSSTGNTTGESMPGMPHTGSGDSSLWLVAALAAGATLIGFGLRRRTARQVRQ